MEATTQRATRDAGVDHFSDRPCKLLVETGVLLARARNLEAILQSVLDIGANFCSAQWGAFFYSVRSADGTSLPLVKLSGSAAADPTRFPLAGVDHPAIQVLFGNGILRCSDVFDGAPFSPGSPFAALAHGPQPTRSYLAVPVQGAAGDLLGGLFCGDTQTDKFAAACEPFFETLAAQAAIAIESTCAREALAMEAAASAETRRHQQILSQRLTTLLESATEAIVFLDRDWRFTYVNQSARRLLGEGAELLGRSLRDVFPAPSSTFRQRNRDAMDGKASGTFTEFSEPLGKWLSIRPEPDPHGIAIFFEDVTEERRMTSEKAETDRRLRQALDAAQLGTWTWDRASDLLDLDDRAAALYQHQAHVPITRTALRDRLVSSEDRDLTTRSLDRAVDTGGLYYAEYRTSAEPGGTVWLAASGMPTFSPQTGELVGMVGTVQDITLRKTQEEALRQSEKLAATGRLAATIAHEINNPLEAVTNLIYLVKTDPTVPPVAQQLLETADQELARVAQIAQQTLGFYRDTTRPTHIDLGDLLRSVVSLFHRKLSYKKIDCNLDLESNLRIFGLQGELRQVFSNLVVNAIDASFRGRITIRARHVIDKGVPGISVLICDEGTGISLAAQQRLFSPFFTTKVEIGTGLGLWVTRGILEKQGGNIRFRSRTEPPSGTVFRVFLRTTMQISEALDHEPRFLQ